MARLRLANAKECGIAMEMIDQAKAFLKQQGIDQWQQGYPDLACIQQDIQNQKGYFVIDDSENILGYLCLDFAGEPAYRELRGSWLSEDDVYAVVHRLAFSGSSRGKGLAEEVFRLAEQKCVENRIFSLRCDTDDNNEIMKHILRKYGFQYCGTIWFDNSVKIAYEKRLNPI